MPFYVCRQLYYWGGQQAVEINSEGSDHSGPGEFVPCWPQLGEGSEFSDPREAVEAGIAILKEWRKVNSDGKKILVVGGMFDMCEPTEGCTFKEAREWAKKKWGQLEKCPRCGEVVEDLKEKYIAGAYFQDSREEWHFHPYDSGYDESYCSEYCAEKASEWIPSGAD